MGSSLDGLHFFLEGVDHQEQLVGVGLNYFQLVPEEVDAPIFILDLLLHHLHQKALLLQGGILPSQSPQLILISILALPPQAILGVFFPHVRGDTLIVLHVLLSS